MITPTAAPSRPVYQARDIEIEEHSSNRNREELAPPHAVNIPPRWNESKSTVWRATATGWCISVMGANDAALTFLNCCLAIDVTPIH